MNHLKNLYYNKTRRTMSLEQLFELAKNPKSDLVIFVNHQTLSPLLTSTEFDFGPYFEWASKMDIVAEGKVGKMSGMQVYTDAYFNPEDKWLPHDIEVVGNFLTAVS